MRRCRQCPSAAAGGGPARAVLEHYRNGQADLRVALLLAAGLFAGGHFGAVGAAHLPELWLRRVFAIAMVAIGGKMWFGK
jgi:uncharacterized membrane protein YfcA